MGIHLHDLVENIVGKKEIPRYVFFSCNFLKAVSCWCVKMSIYGVKG